MSEEIITKTAKRIYTKLSDDISDRQGIGHSWDLIEDDIKFEIQNEWLLIIESEIRDLFKLTRDV